MRSALLCCLLFVGMATANAQSVLDRRISISLAGVTLEEALARVAAAAQTTFSYSDNVVPLRARVSLQAHDRPLRNVLDTLLLGFSLAYKPSHGRIVIRHAPAPLTQTVRGMVMEELTQRPLPGASVTIAGTTPLLGATADADGKFRIANVPVGRATLVVTSVGYQPKTLANMLLGTGKELVVEIKLGESVTAMEEVVVTARRGDDLALAETALVSGRSFSVEETKRYAGSLGDPARMAAGFVSVTGASDESNALVVRGNSPRGVLWRVEGIEVPNPNHFATEGSSNGIVSVLSANIIDNSDFLSGAFPALYGNALSAVFDMKLREGNNQQREHSFQAGVLGMEASTEGPFSRRHTSSYLVNYRYSTLNILDQLGVELNDAGEYRNYQDLSFKMDFPAGAGKLSVFGIGGLSKADQQQTNAARYDHSDMGVTGVTYRVPVHTKTFLTTSVSWSGTRISNNNQIRGLSAGLLEVEEHYSKSYARASVLVDKKWSDRFFLDAGFIYSRLYYDFYLRNLDPTNSAYEEIINFQEQGNTGIVQAFAMGRQHFSPTVTAVYGVHFLQFGLTNDQSVEPRASIRWQVLPGQTLTAGYGKHSRIENLQYYLARDHQAGGDEVQINKGLSFTRAHHYVAGYEQALPAHHVLKTEVYYQELTDAPVQSDPASVYASINEDSGFITDTLINSGRGKNYGVELSFERIFQKGFYYQLNGSVYQSRFRIADGAERNTSYNGNYSFHLLAGREFASKAGRAVFGVNVKMAATGGKRYVPIDLAASIEKGYTVYDWDEAFEPRLPAYFRADVQLVYRRNHPRYATEWRLDIQNVTNHLNAAYYYFNADAAAVRLKHQVGILPILSYRIEF